MRVLVTGASGFVGRHLVANLRQGHNSAIPLVRNGAAQERAAGVAGPADLSQIGSWPHWPEALDAVVHLAAVNPGPGERPSLDALRGVNVEGTRALALRVRREGVPRMLFLSTANVHGAGSSSAIDETAPLEPQSLYASTKLEAEIAFREALAGGATSGVVLRPAPVYGAGHRGAVAAMARLARSPLPFPGGIGAPRSILSIDHLLEAITACLRTPAVGGMTFLVADPGPVTVVDIVRALRNARGARPRILPLPKMLSAGIESLIGRTGAFSSLANAFVLDTRRLEATTRWTPGALALKRLSAMAAEGAV